MPRFVFKLALGLALAVLWPQPGLAWMAGDLDIAAVEASEYEVLVTALDEFGLDLDSPELEDMDGGEIWGYIEDLRRERDEAGQKRGNEP